MIFRSYIPSAPLSDFIESFVYFADIRMEHRFDRFLPNGDTEILIDFHDAPQFIYDNTSLKEIQACHNVWASGLRTEPITIPAGDKSEMMVISFKKGMAAPFFPFPMDEIRDSVVDADLVWGSDLSDLRELLLETKDIALRFKMAEQFLVNKFRTKMKLNPCVAFAIGEMTSRPDRINIANMNSKIGYSQKHFGEMFRKEVGITPKAYLKIMRFQRAVQLIDAADAIDWGSIALECGFYDQAHFIHDFKHFSGFTPEKYSNIRGTYQNYIPVG